MGRQAKVQICMSAKPTPSGMIPPLDESGSKGAIIRRGGDLLLAALAGPLCERKRSLDQETFSPWP